MSDKSKIDNGKSTDRIVVAAGSDENYAMPLAVTLYSMVSKLPAGSEIEIFILSLKLSDRAKTRFGRVLKSDKVHVFLTFVDVDISTLNGLPELAHFTSAMYLRFYLPSILPDSYDKVLYLDSDLLVRKDITPLWRSDIGDNFLLAARDFYVQTIAFHGGIRDYRKRGIPADFAYFNSGVLLMNLKKWRNTDLGAALREYVIQNSEHLLYPDQDALNVVCYPFWQPLNLTWNVASLQVTDFEKWPASGLRDYVESQYHDVCIDPSICHFTSSKKPWVPGYRVPFQDEWLRALKNSAWFTPNEFHKFNINWRMSHYIIGAKRKLAPATQR